MSKVIIFLVKTGSFQQLLKKKTDFKILLLKRRNDVKIFKAEIEKTVRIWP
ncbi:hypothetical protein NIASO_18255 [Niabella soli DSM 19437]|uniref:Uncharacterized protein n=1 Tax=Niabella soli DSM 19437 TaxID=929713 RepID=W0F4Q0_9BACT|nr:hypothetical protein NIASO_18255 [Niabella soli DSM 19437]